jgi:GNAT superfamily N-acetyltransferase
MRIVLRPARPADFEFCATLYFAEMEEVIRQLNLDVTSHTRGFRDRWNVAEVEIISCDHIEIGWVQTSIVDGALYLGQIFIVPPFQRRGIGTGVIIGIIDKATKADRPVTLSVVKANPAKKLYERLGFRVTDTDDRKFYMRRDA